MGDVFFRTAKSYITYVVRILEGYEHIGVVTTVDSVKGVSRVRATPDTEPLVRSVLASLPIPIEIITAPEDFKKMYKSTSKKR